MGINQLNLILMVLLTVITLGFVSIICSVSHWNVENTEGKLTGCIISQNGGFADCLKVYRLAC